jgi:hypothetical protein
MRSHRCLIAVALAVGCFASVAQASLLYEQTFFNPGMGGGDLPITDYGWAVDAPGWYSGSYSGDYAPELLDAANNQPINGNSAIYLGNGGPLTEALGLLYVVEGFGGLDNPIDPSQCDRCLLTAYTQPGPNGAADDLGYFAVRVRDAADDRAEPVWYIATNPMAPPTAAAGSIYFDFRSLDYHTASWDELTVDETGAVAPVRGATVGVLPSGLLINGLGIASSLTNPENDYSGLNYADYRVLCVPEPSALLLLAAAAPLAIALRRRK